MQEVKREHDTRFLEGEEHLHFDGDIYMKIGWRPLKIHNISSIYNNFCGNNNNRHRKVYRLLDYRWKEWR
jgi:hypothetical protein